MGGQKKKRLCRGIDYNGCKTKKPCEYEVSYVKITYGKDGKASTITVKYSKAKASGDK